METKKITNALMLTSSLCSLGFISSACSNSNSSKKKMNILYIMCDDLTSQAIGAYGSRLATLNPTPVIDKELAANGIVFDDCFDVNSISTPSRANILTGQYSHTNGVLTLDEALMPCQEYLPMEMKQLGYTTAMIGKWHQHCEPSAFDYYQVLIGHGGQGTYFDPEFCTNEVKGKYPNNTKKYTGHVTKNIADITLDWLKNKRDKSKPFFLMHHFKAPHDNFEFAPEYKDYLADVDIPMPKTLFNRKGFGSIATRGANDSLVNRIGTSVSNRHLFRNYVQMYKINTGNDSLDTKMAYNEYLKRYLRCVKGVDDQLKRIFDYLKENKLWDNTIIIITGDQGMMLGEHDLQDKRWMYEESMRMPFIIRVPGMKNAGTHNDQLVCNVDFAPTLLSLAGENETPRYMQGYDFSPILYGKKTKYTHEAIYYRYWMHMIHHDVPAHFGIRTKDYKLIFFYGRHYDPSRYGERTMVWEKWGESNLIEPTPAAFELYDMKNDPHETTNLANNPKYAKVLADLKQQLLALKAKVGDSDTSNPEIQKVINENFKEFSTNTQDAKRFPKKYAKIKKDDWKLSHKK